MKKRLIYQVETNAKGLMNRSVPVVLGVTEPLSDSVFTVTSLVGAGVLGEVVSSFTSTSVLDCDWTAALPLAARSYNRPTETLATAHF